MIFYNGLIKEIDGCGKRGYSFDDDILILTDSREYAFSDIKCVEADNSFIYQADGAVFTVSYNNVANTAFLARSITAKFDKDTIISRIGVKVPRVKDKVMYNTFFNASAAAFFRDEKLGLCCGFENPFCHLEDDFLYFEPSLVVKANEEYACDLNFYGAYEIYGDLIAPELNRTEMYINDRYHPRYRNPGEGTPLYLSEIVEFGKYTKQYFDCEHKQFKFMCYDFFGNLPQRPETEEMCQRYLNHIDAVAELGCDTILLNPLYPNEIPNGDPDSCWELFPKDTYAEKILNYARAKGLKIGMYTGTAGNGIYGNSSMIPYADNPQWKKINVRGNMSQENCIADDAFVDWFIKVQLNTIKKYSLDVWNWDPGPGSGFFCYSDKHGHLPGKGAYKGFRNTLKVMKALKDAVPNLYYQGFHGNKEYGLWGFKYIDQHEAYWENEVYVMNPVFDDLSMDRATANNIRQQSAWNYYFRFMPATINHGIAHRMVQANWMNLYDLDLVFDYTGWKYSLLSSIAYGGPITVTIVPRFPEQIKEYKEFYKKWIGFAKEIFHYSSHTVPFGAQVGCGIDAVAKIIENNGYIFVFNPFPKDHAFTFELDRKIGFTDTGAELFVDMIYPYGDSVGSFGYGQSVELTVPAYECIVLQVSTTAQKNVKESASKALPRALYGNENGEYAFYGDTEIKKCLEYNKITDEAIAVQKQYSEIFNRINSCWTHPDRLWLFVRPEGFDAPSNAEIELNGHKIPWQQDFVEHRNFCVKNMVFADVTDFISWNTENKLCLTGFSESAVYLHYPRPQNEQLPSCGEPCEVSGAVAPQLDDEIKVLWARVNEDNVIMPVAINTVAAELNLPVEEVEGVYASVPISIGHTGEDLRCDMTLEYDNGIWKKSFPSGDRIHLIIDDCKLVVWAVSKKNTESMGYSIPIDWAL